MQTPVCFCSVIQFCIFTGFSSELRVVTQRRYIRKFSLTSGYKLSDAITLVSIKCLLFFCCLLSMYLFFIGPAYSANWVEVEVGEDSGDTYLWPYFYTASRFVDGTSIKKSSEGITYVELVNDKKAISPNVTSLVVSKKSKCDGEKVVWQNFYIYKSAMGLGKPIMRLNPNEAQQLKKGGAGALTDAFACELAKLN